MDAHEKASLKIAEEIANMLLSKPAPCLGLPTGRSPRAVYEHLVQISGSRSLDWSGTKCFGLDDYLDTADQSHTFRAYLERNLYEPVGVLEANKFNPTDFDDYDSLIAQKGGLDLTILGIGTNGHIAFNEPGTPRQSWTHSIWLTRATREQNRQFFPNSESVPFKAVTMGISTILASRRIILLAFGETKKAILETAMNGPIDSSVPASYLQAHENLSVYTDF